MKKLLIKNIIHGLFYLKVNLKQIKTELVLWMRFIYKQWSKHMESRCFQWVQLIICKLYFNKVDLRKRNTQVYRDNSLGALTVASSWW